MTYLAKYWDPALRPEEGQTTAGHTDAERIRLLHDVIVVRAVYSFPRRISDATDAELALDKKRSRRVLHVLDRCLQDWGGKSPKDWTEPGQDQRREAAQLDWALWKIEHEAWLNQRIRYLATWAVYERQEAWGKSAVVRLNNELGWITYALRD